MRNGVDMYWWGVSVWLDEERTKELLNALDVSSVVIGFGAVFAPNLPVKVVAGAAVAVSKLESIWIKTVDERGGHHGVVLNVPWTQIIPTAVGIPASGVPAWVVPQVE
jgi:hypothetical protein